MKEWNVVYITELGEFGSVCQLLQVVVLVEDGAPKAILYGGGLVKSTGHRGEAGGYWDWLYLLSLDFWAYRAKRSANVRFY